MAGQAEGAFLVGDPEKRFDRTIVRVMTTGAFHLPVEELDRRRQGGWFQLQAGTDRAGFFIQHAKRMIDGRPIPQIEGLLNPFRRAAGGDMLGCLRRRPIVAGETTLALTVDGEGGLAGFIRIVAIGTRTGSP